MVESYSTAAGAVPSTATTQAQKSRVRGKTPISTPEILESGLAWNRLRGISTPIILRLSGFADSFHPWRGRQVQAESFRAGCGLAAFV